MLRHGRLALFSQQYRYSDYVDLKNSENLKLSHNLFPCVVLKKVCERSHRFSSTSFHRLEEEFILSRPTFQDNCVRLCNSMVAI